MPARYVAKNIVAAGLADKCEIQVSYAIGVAQPTSISVTTFGTGKIPEEKIEKLVREHFDLRPFGILKMLDLLHPMYRRPPPTATSVGPGAGFGKGDPQRQADRRARSRRSAGRRPTAPRR